MPNKKGKHSTRSRTDKKRRQLIQAAKVVGQTAKQSLSPPPIPEDLEHLPPGYVIARFVSHPSRFGFAICENGEPDIFIAARHTREAWQGDRILVWKCDPPSPQGQDGIVMRLLERTDPGLLPGHLRRARGTTLFCPESRHFPPAMTVVSGLDGPVQEGMQVVARVTNRGNGTTLPAVAVQQSFGDSSTREAQVETLLYLNNINRLFPADVLAAALRVPQEVPDEALEGRLDLRGKLVFTIDGADAKDLDDAVSLSRNGEGHYLLGVHIADVSHYVAEDSPLDQEAFARGTSVYFADQVIPMLPPELSNGICSLHAQVDRLTVSALMVFDREGHLLKSNVRSSVIHSAERMTYDDCNALLSGDSPELAARYANILPTLREMAELSRVLTTRRREQGALDIVTHEPYFVCDPTGRPTEISTRPMGVSEQIIESFMLTANEAVASFLTRHKRPVVYRIHDKPSEDAIANFGALAVRFGLPFPVGRIPTSTELQETLIAAEGSPQQALLNHALPRCLAKAKYSTENIGHYGLASAEYCHFTSPIRRYPDLVIHRLVKHQMSGFPGGALRAGIQERALAAAEQSTAREILTDTATRRIEKCYKADYMVGHIGEEYTGQISGIVRSGFFVELENTVEGLVPLESLGNDIFTADELGITLSGQHTRYTVGDRVWVQCVAARPSEGLIDFVLVEPASVVCS